MYPAGQSHVFMGMRHLSTRSSSLSRGHRPCSHNPAAVEPGGIGFGVLPHSLLGQVQLPLRKTLRLSRAGLVLQERRLVTGSRAGPLGAARRQTRQSSLTFKACCSASLRKFQAV